MSHYPEEESVRFNQIENIVLRCNKQAMESLNKNKHSEAITLLQKASQILTNLTPTYTVIKFKAITLNNLGCLYKRINDNNKALQYLTQALDYEAKLPEEFANMAGTHLNICAIKSHLNDHDEALNHALKAINIIQRNDYEQVSFITTLVAAYHNAGIEYQFLNRKIEANNFFRQGYELSFKKLGKNHPLTRNLEANAAENKKNQLETLEKPKKFIKDWKIKEDSLFDPEISIFNEETPVKKINVDTTPWPKYSEKKSWPLKVEPIKYREAKPLSSFLNSNDSGLKLKQNDSAQAVFSQRKINPKSISRNLSNKTKPDNIHLHHKEDPKPSFKLRTKVEPSAKSLNSSPSKAHSSFKSIENPSIKKENSNVSIITADKINIISAKLETLQEKLNQYEENCKELGTLSEEDDDQSIISTQSYINKQKTNAAILIQKNFRRYLKQKKFKTYKQAAVKIQKISRGVCLRRKIQRDFYHSKDFSQQYSPEPPEPIFIKTVEKSNQTERKKNLSSVRIVSVASNGCKPAKKKRKTLLQNIVMVQAHIRRFLAKKYCKKRLQAIVKIQKAYKKHRFRSIYLKVISAIVFIQCVYRGYRARKFVKTILPKGVLAILQSEKRW